ncbi:hypothetical protein Tco_1245170 [Tanacetum coccineum]
MLKSRLSQTNPESYKDSEAESLTPLPSLKTLQGASPSSEVESLTFQPHSLKERPCLGFMKHTKPKTQDSLNKSVLGIVIVSKTEPTTHSVPTKIQKTESFKSVDSSKTSQDSKPKVQNSGPSKSLRPKPIQKPQLKPDDCRNYPDCEICGSYDHFTSEHNRVIHIRGGVLAESSQSSESSIDVKCNACEIIVHFTTDYNEFDHFKRETHHGAYLVPRQWMLKVYDWCQELSTQMSPRRNDVYVLDMSSLTPNGACFFAKALESVNWL